MADFDLHTSIFGSGVMDSQYKVNPEKKHFPSNYQPSPTQTTEPISGFKVKLRRDRLRVQYTDNPWEMHLLSGRDRPFLAEWLQVCPAGSIYLDPKIGVSAIKMWSDLAIKSGKIVFLAFERTHQLPRNRHPRQWLIKRCVDWLLGCGLFLVATPLFVTLALLLRWSGNREVFNHEWSVGQGGKLFPAYRFKVEISDLHNSQLSQVALRKWIHNSGIIHLPQLINVLKGEMSLIGIYPRSVSNTLAMSNSHRRYLNATPGMLGIYQFSDAQDCTHIHSRELEYLRTWSLWKDLKIFLKGCEGKKDQRKPSK